MVHPKEDFMGDELIRQYMLLLVTPCYINGIMHHGKIMGLWWTKNSNVFWKRPIVTCSLKEAYNICSVFKEDVHLATSDTHLRHQEHQMQHVNKVKRQDSLVSNWASWRSKGQLGTLGTPTCINPNCGWEVKNIKSKDWPWLHIF